MDPEVFHHLQLQTQGLAIENDDRHKRCQQKILDAKAWLKADHAGEAKKAINEARAILGLAPTY